MSWFITKVVIQKKSEVQNVQMSLRQNTLQKKLLGYEKDNSKS